MKLTKLSEDHYVIVDDYGVDIYSTQKVDSTALKTLSISEVEEAIYGYSCHKMAVDYCNKHYKQQDWVENFDNYCSGFNAHKELVKDKLFTIQDMFAAIKLARQDFDEGGYTIDVMHPKEIIQSLLPKTEWECIIDEQGKLKLI